MRISDWSSDVCSSDLPVLAIFLARIAQVAALFADVAAIAVTDRLADVALLFANFLPVAAKFAGLGLGHCGNHHRGDQAGGEKLHLLHFAIPCLAVDRKSTRLNSSH